MRYSPVSPPQDLILPYQQKDRQPSFLSRLLPIVFDDKALSGVFILVILPAYLQLAPLPKEPQGSGNAADYQWSIGIMGLSPLRGSLRAALSEKKRKYHYTRHLHRRKQPSPHDLHSKSGCYSSPEVAHSLAGGPGVGSCVASQKRKDPQH